MVISMNRWSGKVAVVTGASSGIGSAIVDQLVEHGLQVVGIARRLDVLEVKSHRLKDLRGKLHPYKADFSKEEDIVEAFKWIESNLGPVHILVNNAGCVRKTTLVDGDAQAWKDTLELNVLGLSIATREAIAGMKKSDVKGHVVHINSVSGHQVVNFPEMNMYPASKYAVTALTETLRWELIRMGLKIKVTSVSPGLVATEMTTLNKDLDERTRAEIEALPILNPEDIADGVIYALSTPEHVQVHELTIRPVGEPF